MNILFLSQRVPEPPNKGDKIRSHHMARRLAERHAVHVACLADDEREAEHAEAARRWASSVTWRVRKGAESAVRGAAAALTGSPMTSGFFHSAELADEIRRLRERERFDVVVAYCSGMARYLAQAPEARVLDLVDVDSEKWREYASRSALPKKALYALEHKLLRGYEQRLVREFDRCIIISEQERDVLAKFAEPERVVAVSNGVDADWLERRAPRTPGASLVFVGALDYFANIEGITYFARDVFPAVRDRLPESTLRIVGRAPVDEVRALGGIEGVEVVGEVADMRPEVWGASVAVVPLRIAPGIQNKVLEAMAAGTPVVATRAALKSIDGEAGLHFSAADRPEEFVKAIAELVEDPSKADAQALRARDLVRDEYSWDRKARDYEAVLEEAVASRRQVGEPL